MRSVRQTTLRERASLVGTGVHTNAPVRIVLHPSDANSGIVFLRTGLPSYRDRLIEARWSKVSLTELCTVIGEPSDVTIATVEHLLAALCGLGVDNVLIEIDGPEVPIMDGSAADFVEAIDQAGIVELAAPRRWVKVLKPVRVERGRAFSELCPVERGFRLDVEIDFDARVIGRQKKVIELDSDSFRRDLSRARTFGFVDQVEELWKKGFALGSSLENSVALDGERILNPEGLRYSDEFVRHKALDALGDLALAGAPIIGSYRSFCGGHKMNVAVLEALFSDRTAFQFIESPLRRERSRGGMRQPALFPELN